MDKRAKITIFIGLGILLMGVVGMIIGAAGIGVGLMVFPSSSWSPTLSSSSSSIEGTKCQLRV